MHGTYGVYVREKSLDRNNVTVIMTAAIYACTAEQYNIVLKQLTYSYTYNVTNGPICTESTDIKRFITLIPRYNNKLAIQYMAIDYNTTQSLVSDHQ